MEDEEELLDRLGTRRCAHCNHHVAPSQVRHIMTGEIAVIEGCTFCIGSVVERSRKALETEVDRRLADRTRGLEDRLAKAEKEAADLSRSLGAASSRTPMTPIFGTEAAPSSLSVIRDKIRATGMSRSYDSNNGCLTKEDLENEVRLATRAWKIGRGF